MNKLEEQKMGKVIKEGAEIHLPRRTNNKNQGIIKLISDGL
jgi:hypothetical protein